MPDPNQTNPNQNSVTPNTQQVPIVTSNQEDLPPISPNFQGVTTSNDTSADFFPPVGASSPKKSYGGGRVIATILGILLLLGGVGAGIILTLQPQIFKQQAYTGTCSAPGSTCPTGSTCANGYCVDTQSDPNNCGGIGRLCPGGFDCSHGICVNTQSDPNNCGGIGRVCPRGSTCIAGACVNAWYYCRPGITCPTGTTCIPDGDGGTCGTSSACVSPNVMQGGVCVPPPTIGCTNGTWEASGGYQFCSFGGSIVCTTTTLLNGGDACLDSTGAPTACANVDVIRCNCSGDLWVSVHQAPGTSLKCSDVCGAAHISCSSTCQNTPPNQSNPTPTPQPTKTPSPTPTKTPSPTPTKTPSPTPTKTSSPTPTPTKTPSPTPTKTPTPTPTSTKTPSPTPSSSPTPGPTAICSGLKAYDSGWTELSSAQLSGLKAGNNINFCVAGTASSGSFDMGRFTINGVVQAQTTTKRPSSNDFCQAYTIPAGVTTFNITAQIHHVTLGWEGP